MMQRYSIYTSLVESVGFEVKPQSDGNYVKYEDAMHRIKELEQETERLRNCLHHVLEENKRGYHLTGTDELTNSLAKRDLEQQAKGVHSLFIQCQSDALVETWEISEYAEQLRKKAEGLK